MNRSPLILFLSFIVFVFVFTSCGSNEVGNSKDVNPESIYFDYKVWGDEGNDDATVMLQYKFAGRNGTTLVLDEPSKVELDGQEIKVDSSKMTGAFYEVIKPLKDFIGKHNIVFTNLENKQYQEEFNFRPISLRTKIPAEIKRGDLAFDLDGLEPMDYVRVLLTDTSFASDDINWIDTVRNGRVVITKEDLKRVVNGPVHLELIKEIDKPVKNGTREGGQFSFSYGLKREFVLKN